MFYSADVIAGVHLIPAISPTIVSMFAFVLAVPFSYAAHRMVTFADRPRDALQPLRFVVSTGLSFFVAVGGMYWITEFAGKSYLFGIVWNCLVIPAMNFLIYLYWVFRAARDEGQAA